MKAVARSMALGALALAFMGSEAAAQFAGMPVNYAPASSGVSVGAYFGRGINNNSGKANSANAEVTFGGPSFFVGAGAGYADFSDAKLANFGGRVGIKLPLGPETPIDLAVVAGGNYSSKNSVKTLFVPAGVTLAFAVPSQGTVGITPWVSGQFRYVRVSAGGVSASNSNGGVSGGLRIDTSTIGFDVIGDYDFESKGLTVGGGIRLMLPSGS